MTEKLKAHTQNSFNLRSSLRSPLFFTHFLLFPCSHILIPPLIFLSTAFPQEPAKLIPPIFWVSVPSTHMGLLFSRNLASFVVSSLLLSKKLPANLVPMRIENMVSLVSARTGRHRQRYSKGCRLVVGCIPYRYRDAKQSFSVDNMEVLVISSQKGQAMLFPKGGWENDESMEAAASRETLEEAGVVGKIESRLGKWQYKSKSQNKMHEGYMFSLLVNEQLNHWPEKGFRKREWISVEKAKEVCPHSWMKEALDVLVSQQMEKKENGSNCT